MQEDFFQGPGKLQMLVAEMWNPSFTVKLPKLISQFGFVLVGQEEEWAVCLMESC